MSYRETIAATREVLERSYRLLAELNRTPIYPTEGNYSSLVLPAVYDPARRAELMEQVAFLQAQAAKSRRLAAGLVSDPAHSSLLALANSYESRAEEILSALG